MKDFSKNIETFLYKRFCLYAMASCATISIVITIIENLLITFGPENTKILNSILMNARSLFIYFAAASLVGLLADLRIRLRKIDVKNFCNKLEARNRIIKKIIDAAFLSKNETLEIKVYGRRLTQNINSIKQALNNIELDNRQHRNIDLYLYYSNSEFLQSLKSFNRDDILYPKLIDVQINHTNENIDGLKRDIVNNRYKFVTVHYRKHFDTPQFWAIQIDNKDIFWGYFMLQEKGDSEFFEGSLNNCFHFDNKNMELDGFSDWINNNFKRLEKWSKKESP